MGSGSFFKVLLKNFDVLAGPLITLVYPLYASVRAIETQSPTDDRQWLTYWVLYSLITLFELTFVKVIQLLPFWPFAKFVFNCWLVLPYFSGAAYVYEHYVRPMFVNQQTVNIWYVPRKKSIFSKPDDVLAAAEKYIEENGTGALEKIIKKKAEKDSKPSTKAPKTEKASKFLEKLIKPSEKVHKPLEKEPKPIEKESKPRKTNRRVTFDDVAVEKTSVAQKSESQPFFSNYKNNHNVFDDHSLRPIFDEYDDNSESNSWGNSNFMIFDDEYSHGNRY